MKFQLACLSGRLAPRDAIDSAFQFEHKLDFGRLALAGGHTIDDIIVAPHAALAEKGPGDPVEDRRLARAIGSGNGGQMKSTQIDRGLRAIG